MPIPAKPSSKICQAVDVIKRIMKNQNFALHDGCIYKLAPEAMYTYIYCSTVKAFILSKLYNAEVADVVVPYVTNITALLSEPACRLIQPIKLDLDLIEVLPSGTCFVISEKTFTTNLESFNRSPRAFVKYRYNPDVIPRPTKFIEGKSISDSFFKPNFLLETSTT